MINAPECGEASVIESNFNRLEKGMPFPETTLFDVTCFSFFQGRETVPQIGFSAVYSPPIGDGSGGGYKSAARD